MARHDFDRGYVGADDEWADQVAGLAEEERKARRKAGQDVQVKTAVPADTATWPPPGAERVLEPTEVTGPIPVIREAVAQAVAQLAAPPAEGADALGGPILVTGPAAELNRLASEWLEVNPRAVLAVQEALHARELARARQPVAVNVTWTPPQGTPNRGWRVLPGRDGDQEAAQFLDELTHAQGAPDLDAELRRRLREHPMWRDGPRPLTDAERARFAEALRAAGDPNPVPPHLRDPSLARGAYQCPACHGMSDGPGECATCRSARVHEYPPRGGWLHWRRSRSGD